MAWMPTSPTGTRFSRGFSLIELMVVLAIVVIMGAVAMVSMQPVLRDSRMRSGCRMIASTLNYARSHAVTTHRPVRVVFTDEDRVEVYVYQDKTDSGADGVSAASVGVSGKELVSLNTSAAHCTLPEGVSVTQVSKAGGVGDENWLELGALGEVDQAIIELSDQHGEKKYVALDRITGRCQIRSDEEQQHYEDIATQEALQAERR